MTTENARRTHSQPAPFVVELKALQPEDRLHAWTDWTQKAFPNVRLTKIAAVSAKGFARRLSIGPGFLYTIVSASQVVQHSPPAHDAQLTSGLLLQQQGTCHISQAENSCQLTPGCCCLVDGLRQFEVRSIGLTRLLVFTFPSDIAALRFPELLSRHTAKAVSGNNGATSIIRNLLEDAFQHAETLEAKALSALYAALMVLIDALPIPNKLMVPAFPWRVRRALDDLDTLIGERSLSARTIAQRQNISRRHLDTLFIRSIGSTVTNQILARRLAQAAADLCDPSQDSTTITSIAFAAGFCDTAHFARAFRRRFGCSPTGWRAQAEKANTVALQPLTYARLA